MALKLASVVILCVCVIASVGAAERDADMHPDITLPEGPAVRSRMLKYEKELETNYWLENAQDHLKHLLEEEKRPKLKRAKNVIFFLGDGMSLATVAATRMHIGGEEKKLSFEKFSHFGLSKTYCVDKQVADSACSATAFLSGVKGNYGTIGVNANVKIFDCTGENDPANRTESLAKWAQDKCKSTGFVTTSRVTHATPGGLFAHTAHRNWENDNKVRESKCNPDETIDIARQLIDNEEAKKFKVILGCGRREFRDKTVFDEENKRGTRSDGRDLIDAWIKSRSQHGNASYVWHKQGLNSIDISKTDYLMGLFDNDNCPYNHEIDQQNLGDVKPKLDDMTEVAIKMLSKEKNGYFLFVEGARIDMAHHETWAYAAIDETKEFDRAIQKALQMTDPNETLIVVTADHAHTMTYNGYSHRGRNIFDVTEENGSDGLPYTTLSYANGNGYNSTYYQDGTPGRRDVSKLNFTDPKLLYPATAPNKAENHGGEDVGVWAYGPLSELFVGNYEQNNIAVAVAYALKVGPYAIASENTCSKPGGEQQHGGNNSAHSGSITVVTILFSLLIAFIFSN